MGLEMNKQKDIFDKIMDLSVFIAINPFYKKHKELLLYLLFGGLAFVISISSFSFLNVVCKINEHISNIFSWIFAVSFAYITNKKWVFDSKTINKIQSIREIVNFLCGRLATLIIEELILYTFITKLKYPSILIKVIAQIVVIILNYIVSKIFVFKNTK